MSRAAVALLFVILVGSVALPLGQLARAVTVSPGPTIQVVVTDNFGLSIDGALVEIIETSNVTLVSAGQTVNGSFTSPPLLPNANYTVMVSTEAQTKSQQVSVATDNLVLQFTMMRSFPTEQLLVTKVTQSLVETNGEFQVQSAITVNNTGQANVATSTLALVSTGPLTVLGAGSQFLLGALPAGASTTITVAFGVSSRTAPNTYPVTYNLVFTDVYGRTATGGGSFGVDLNGLAGGPDVLISAMSLSINNISPGGSAVFTVGLVNAGDQPALGVTVGVSGLTGALSNTESYAGLLNTSATASRDFGVNLPDDFQPGLYTLNVTVSYTGPSGNAYSFTQPYTMRVLPTGEPLVVVQNVLTDPTKLTDGTTGVMTVFLTNLGTGQARNIVAKVSGASGLLANGIFTIGKIDPGATETVLLTINIDQSAPTGTYLVTTQLTFSDTIGRSFNQSSFQELSVYSLPTIFTTTNIGLMAGAGIAVVAALILIRRLGIRI